MDTIWESPPCDLKLLQGDIHVWLAATDQDQSTLAGLKELLSEGELEKAAKFRDSQAQSHFIVGRGCLRQILGMYLHQNPADVRIGYGYRGKPVLEAPENAIRFNLSHSGGVILLAFASDQDVGIDVEQLRPIEEAGSIAERFFTVEEAAHVAAAGISRPEVFYNYWTRKEALLKCSGCGIGDEELHVVSSSDLTVCGLCPARGYMAALATSSPRFTLKTWHWAWGACFGNKQNRASWVLEPS